MTNILIEKVFENVELSKDDFLYALDSDVYYHWSGFGITAEALLLGIAVDYKAELDKHLSRLTSKEERLEKFNLYKEHYKFICDFKDWLFNKIMEELDINNLTDYEEKQEAYKAKRREYISGWEPMKPWHANDLTSNPTKIPTVLRQKIVEAWDYVIAYRRVLFSYGKMVICRL